MEISENGVMMTPWETFREHWERAKSGEPYNDVFLKKCREKALEYDKGDPFLRGIRLSDLRLCVPRHFQEKVFDGIRMPDRA